MNRVLAFLLAAACALSGQDLRRLPDWARPHAEAGATESAPDQADAWVLLDRTELAYVGGGEIRTRHLRLVKILTENGLGEAVYSLSGLGGGASKVKKLRGWNVRLDGQVEKIDLDDVVTVETSSGGELTQGLRTLAVLPRVTKGCLVAFESLHSVTLPPGPVDQVYLLESNPIRRWELEVAKQDGWFTRLDGVELHLEPRHFKEWSLNPQVVPGRSFRADRVPALPREEHHHPHPRNMLPWVSVRFVDPSLKTAPASNSWDAVGAWTHANYVANARPAAGLKWSAPGSLEALVGAHQWVARNLVYKQVYLTAARGWIPESSVEVVRKRYGDCKDLTACLMGEAQSAGFQAFPALARIQDGLVEADEPPSPLAFNHVIVAVRLPRSLGLGAEVETPEGRFLLVDPTDRYTPLGRLYQGHRGRRVLICGPTRSFWCQVPEGAIQASGTRVSITGHGEAGGRLTADLVIEEEGNAFGFRDAGLGKGLEGLRDHLLAQALDLPPTGTFQVTSMGDPLDGTKPFRVEAKLMHPSGLHWRGGEVDVTHVFMPGAPAPIAKSGRPRVFPIHATRGVSLHVEGRIQVPRALNPVLGTSQTQTPLRTLGWQASGGVDAKGPWIAWTLSHQRWSADFGFDQIEAGQAAWKADRSQMRAFVAEALTFKVP